MRKNAIVRFGGTKIRKEQDENDTGDKNKEEDVVQKLLFFFQEKLEQGREFRSEGILVENNDREARKKLQNQLIIQSQQMKARQSQAIRALQEQQAQILAFLLENQFSLFQMNCVWFSFRDCI